MKWGRTEPLEGFHVFGGRVALVLREAVAGIGAVELFESRVAMGFGEDRSSGDGNASSVALNERFLLDEYVQLHCVDKQVVWRDGELLERGRHGLAAGLVNIPGINAGGVDFGDCKSESVFADAQGEFTAAFRSKFFRIVKADDAAFGIEDDGCSDDGAEEGASTGFVDAGDARPAELASGSLKPGRALATHLEKCAIRIARGKF